MNYTWDKVLNIDKYMNEDKLINSLANTLISQYGDDAETVATLRAQICCRT